MIVFDDSKVKATLAIDGGFFVAQRGATGMRGGGAVDEWLAGA